MVDLTGKCVLVTGGTSGIGYETARQFLDAGASLIVTGSSQQSADSAREQLGDNVVAIGADSRSPDTPKKVADLVAHHFGSLDAAFLNAGVSDWRPFEKHDAASFDRLFDINVKAVFFLAQALIPVLANPSSVVLNSSVSAHGGFADSNAYAASKAAVSSLARSWNSELLRTRGIRFNTVSPGPIDTPLYDKADIPNEYREQAMDGIRQGIPLGRFGQASEIAAAVVFLASPSAAFIVGQDVVIDGGQTVL